MPTSWNESRVECPFYKYDDGKKGITCEGCVSGSITRTLFNTKAQQDRHLRTYCCKSYKQCPIYAMLVKKYEG